jgi:hypothetical protein
MPLALLLTSDILDAHYDEDNSWLYLDWKGAQVLEQVQALCQQVSSFLEQTGAQKVLNDNTRVTGTNWNLVKWLANEYVFQAGRLGLNYVAWVNSPVLCCRNDIDQMTMYTDAKPQVAVFDDVATAYEWLSNVTVPVAVYN